ncbi:hypothetical protein FQA39_LY07246 [Lamprigera yunnana]|nr:hypothetical protein FQA39_LY07246 [Lamprigera yunnana]
MIENYWSPSRTLELYRDSSNLLGIRLIIGKININTPTGVNVSTLGVFIKSIAPYNLKGDATYQVSKLFYFDKLGRHYVFVHIFFEISQKQPMKNVFDSTCGQKEKPEKLVTSVPTEPKLTTSVPTEPKLATSVPTEPKLATSVPTEPKLTTSVPTEPKLATSVPTELKSTDNKLVKDESYMNEINTAQKLQVGEREEKDDESKSSEEDDSDDDSDYGEIDYKCSAGK